MPEFPLSSIQDVARVMRAFLFMVSAMRTLRLVRFAYLSHVTLGRIELPSGEDIFTMERPWLNNTRNKSCIPEGVYECKPYSGTKFKDVYEVCDVPGRSAILIHTANRPNEVQGCIAPGMELIPDFGGVFQSRNALNQLKEELASQAFVLEISCFSTQGS